MQFFPRLAQTGKSWLLCRRLSIRLWPEFARRTEVQQATVAIVGNAGYLTDIEQGDYIDAHDVVVRMNNFQTAGFERQVGSKLDVFLTTFHKDVELSRPQLESARWIVASVPFNWAKPRTGALKYRHAEFITLGLARLRRREAYVPDENYFHSLRQALGSYPTTGAMGLLLAVDFLLPVCPRIYITGFSFFEGRSHYFGEERITPGNHNLEREQAVLFRRLGPHIQSGRIRLDERMKSQLQRQAA